MGNDSLFVNSNFGGIPPEISDWDKSRFVVLPVPFDHTTSFQPGTKKGPKAAIEASAYMELYDEELNIEPCDAGIHTLGQLEVSLDSEETIERIRKVASDIISAGKIPVTIGGEHSVTFGVVKALKEKYKDFSVLQFDAHADLRKEYQGLGLSHACVMRRVHELGLKIVQVGIRSMSKDEAEFLQKAENIFTYYAANIIDSDDWMEDAASHLTGSVYITIDVDAFDPAYMPATGTPEPGGLDWYKVIRLLKKVCERCNIIGFDAMELSPIAGQPASDFLTAKLLYKLMGYTLTVSGEQR
ncbi:MAG: agmatinase [Nitrospirae bacterium]|nr:agmatinase [Nitrospirota bacterium]